MADAVSEGYTKDDIASIIEAAKGAVTKATAECEECGHQMRVIVSDWKKQAELLITLIEQIEGKAGQEKPEATTVVIERPAR
jgi:hypothetical protein